MEVKARKNSLSIRYKVFFVLTVLPLFILIIYLLMVLNVFQADKLAYVYESSVTVAKALASQVNTDFKSLLNLAKPMMQEFMLRKGFAQVSQGVLSTDGPIQWISVHAKDPTSGFLKMLDVSEREGANYKSDQESIENFSDHLASAIEKKHLVLVPFKDDRVLLIEGVPGENPKSVYIFAIFATMPDIDLGFRNSGPVENYLLAKSGQILFGSPGKVGTSIVDDLGSVFFDHLEKQKFFSGVEKVKSPVNGEELLAGYSKGGFADIMVVSSIPQDEALKAAKILVIRSLLFVMILICITVILSLFASGKLTSALMGLSVATQRVAEGDFAVRVDVTSNDEVGSLASSFNAMAVEVARLMKETAEKTRMEFELKTARTVQETLFPPNEATIGPIKIAGYYEPASECGGDWWSYGRVGDKIFFWIGDGTGHGAAAALITSAAKSASVIIEKLSPTPKEAMALLNHSVFEVSHGRMMMTFFLGCYDLRSRKFSYCNASHEEPYLIKRVDRSLTKKDLIPLNEINNPRLGESVDSVYEQTEIVLEEGDRVIFYTDGISDVYNPLSVPWGERKFIKAILAVNEEYPDVNVSVKKLVHFISEYRQGQSLQDDITFFMLQVKGEEVDS